MVSIGGNELFITTWGMEGDDQIWRVRWEGRPGMHAFTTGPYGLVDALMDIQDRLEGLHWVEDE